MSEDKKNTKTVAKADEVEIVERSQEEMDAETREKDQKAKKKREPTVKDGVYTEYDVELTNGRKVNVGVIVDHKKLPVTYGSLLAEGNGPALVMASFTVQTRRILEMADAKLEDLELVLADVIERSREFSEAEDE